MWKGSHQFQQISLVALFGDAWTLEVCSPVMGSSLLERNKDCIFRFYNPVASFWCKYCLNANTVPWGNVTPNFGKFHCLPFKASVNSGSLQPCNRKYAFCTETRIAFLGSTLLRFPFDVNIALVQTRCHVERQPPISSNFIVCSLRRGVNSGSLQPRNRKYAFCTETRIVFLGSTFPYLPFDVNIALVQTWYHVEM